MGDGRVEKTDKEILDFGFLIANCRFQVWKAKQEEAKLQIKNRKWVKHHVDAEES